MDKEFKRIFDKLREEMDMTNKVYRVMDGYQTHLDQMVEEGMMTEHEARMDFFCKTSDLLESVANAHVKDEDDDDDAEDEQCDCDDESSETDCDADEDEAINKTIDKLADAIRTARRNGCDVTRIDYAVRRKHRG